VLPCVVVDMNCDVVCAMFLRTVLAALCRAAKPIIPVAGFTADCCESADGAGFSMFSSSRRSSTALGGLACCCVGGGFDAGGCVAGFGLAVEDDACAAPAAPGNGRTWHHFRQITDVREVAIFMVLDFKSQRTPVIQLIVVNNSKASSLRVDQTPPQQYAHISRLCDASRQVKVACDEHLPGGFRSSNCDHNRWKLEM